MYKSSLSAPTGGGGSGAAETEAAAWLDTISFCNGFCQWVDEEWSLDSDSEQPVESTRTPAEAEAAGAKSTQPLAEKNPT
ncbi:hypothetical protein M9458_042973, partial [Cirrhinus mrigala]